MERGKTQRLAEMAANSDVSMMKNVAKTTGKRLYGILNAMRHGVSNGNAEALDNYMVKDHWCPTIDTLRYPKWKQPAYILTVYSESWQEAPELPEVGKYDTGKSDVI